jgi:phosphohistidine phosphatase
MALFLVQHGKSLPKNVDPQQGLSEEGVQETEKIAAVARDYGVSVQKILHSGKARAHRTAEILASHLTGGAHVSPIAGLKPLDDVTAFADTLEAAENVMLVGHLPFMERMASYLTTGSSEHRVFRFQNSGIVCLEKDAASSRWSIVWTLMPRIG